MRDYDKASDEVLMDWTGDDDDKRAFDELYKRHNGKLTVYLARNCHNQHLAEEFAQKAWLKIWESRGTWKGGSFPGWLYTIAMNKLRDHFRRTRTRIEHPMSGLPYFAIPQEFMFDHELMVDVATAVVAAIRRRCEVDRTILLERFFPADAVDQHRADLDVLLVPTEEPKVTVTCPPSCNKIFQTLSFTNQDPTLGWDLSEYLSCSLLTPTRSCQKVSSEVNVSVPTVSRRCNEFIQDVGAQLSKGDL